MATRSPLLRIHDMLESIRGIEKAIAGKTFRDFERSWGFTVSAGARY
jgi:hypothetical protein